MATGSVVGSGGRQPPQAGGLGGREAPRVMPVGSEGRQPPQKEKILGCACFRRHRYPAGFLFDDTRWLGRDTLRE